MLTALRLPLRFDPAALLADLERAQGSAWSPHYNERDYGGDWRGCALRSGSGATTDLRVSAPEFQDTALLAQCPAFQRTLAAFGCTVKAVRLLSLAPGSFIREHTDNALDFEDGEVRIHIPIQTNPGVEFFVNGERIAMEPGGAYYVNVNLPHRVNNRGTAERIHLVIDGVVNDWVREMFARSEEMGRGPSGSGIDVFRERAEEWREQLRPLTDRREFAREAVRLGMEAGLVFHEGDVDAVLDGEPRPGEAGGLAYRLESRGGEPFLTWTDAPEGGAAEPFYEDTVRVALRSPWGKFRRRVARLEERPGRVKGFVFHMSRCGSTLLCQMLKAAGYRVASEPAPVDTALHTNPGWLRAVVAALDVDFVKFDAWHVHKLPEIRAAFPETPWIFLRRDLEAVLASQRRSPGIHVLPGAIDPAALRMTFADVTGLGRAEWAAEVIGKIVGSAERYRDGAGLWVDYAELPGAAWGPVARHFGLELSARQVERMREVAGFDAKAPGVVWVAPQA